MLPPLKPPDAFETLVPCPACAKGMISQKLADKVRRTLGAAPDPLPQIKTDGMPVLPDE